MSAAWRAATPQPAGLPQNPFQFWSRPDLCLAARRRLRRPLTSARSTKSLGQGHRRDKGSLDVTSLLGRRAQSYLPQRRPGLAPPPQKRSGQRPTGCHCSPAALDTARITGCRQQKVARASEPPGGRVPTSRAAGGGQTSAKARGERAERSSADVSGRVGGERLAGRRRAIHGLGRARQAGEDLTDVSGILDGGDRSVARRPGGAASAGRRSASGGSCPAIGAAARRRLGQGRRTGPASARAARSRRARWPARAHPRTTARRRPPSPRARACTCRR